MTFKKNKKIKDDEDDDDGDPESFRETMQISEQDLDHTAYDNYTYKYGTLRKGMVDETEESIRVHANLQKWQIHHMHYMKFLPEYSSHSLPTAFLWGWHRRHRRCSFPLH